MPSVATLFCESFTLILQTLLIRVKCWQMKVAVEKKYKRKLSRAAIEKMSEGGSKGTIEQKSEAGKLGWQAMRRNLLEAAK